MTRFHINQKGEPGRCSAQHSCPFGDFEEDHYSSPEQARDAYERRMSSFAPVSVTTLKKAEESFEASRTKVEASILASDKVTDELANTKHNFFQRMKRNRLSKELDRLGDGVAVAMTERSEAFSNLSQVKSLIAAHRNQEVLAAFNSHSPAERAKMYKTMGAEGLTVLLNHNKDASAEEVEAAFNNENISYVDTQSLLRLNNWPTWDRVPSAMKENIPPGYLTAVVLKVKDAEAYREFKPMVINCGNEHQLEAVQNIPNLTDEELEELVEKTGQVINKKQADRERKLQAEQERAEARRSKPKSSYYNSSSPSSPYSAPPSNMGKPYVDVNGGVAIGIGNGLTINPSDGSIGISIGGIST